jgi:O-antigen/teichoic acid export membrane protein
MLKLIIRQANWGILGAVFAFFIGFFVKIYIIDIVGLEAWGKYVIAQTFSSLSETVLSIGIPFVIIKFIPTFIESNKEKASRIANIFIKYALIVGGFFLILIYFGSDYVNHFLYKDIDDLSWILFVMCIHVPISMLFGVVISLYRSVLKIKEIVLYGTLVAVTLRALLTFVIFQFTDDISHFILVEVFTQILVLSILLYLFNKNEFLLFVKSESKEVTNDAKMIAYGKKMFSYSVIAFISGHALSFIISIKLPSEDVGAYNILLTLTGLTTFLLINLNKVFAPAISKLYHEDKISELNELYKKTTFLINVLAIPLAVIIAIFADEVLGLYTNEMLDYKYYLFFLLLGRGIGLSTGSSGTFMNMAGLENQNLNIQIIRGVSIVVLSLILIPRYGMISVVVLYVISILFANMSYLFYIKRNLNISPFSLDLLKVFALTVISIYFAVNQQYNFQLVHFILIPIGVYLLYFILMFKPIKNLINELI